APRVAPVPSEAPAPDAAPSETVVTETTPETAAEPVPEMPTEATAPPEATTEIVTEATETQDKPESSAPLASTRPKTRPKKPDPAPATETAAEPAVDNSIDALVAGVVTGAASETPTPGTGTAPLGAPMTSGEKDGLRVAVQRCWTIGAVSTDAMNTIVTVRVNMNLDGKPDVASIKMTGYDGGTENSAQIMFRAAKSAIVRCTGDGYPLPKEKYEIWKDLELVFDPNGMRKR
ncbi:MAG: cell envelope biogenesis protein TolA, partial [Albidovulum sp.]